MTPALLAISRQLVALPGFPPRDMIADELVCGEAVGGWPGFRDKAGILWRPDTEADRPAPWLPDLTDAATGGVLLALVPYQAHWRITMERADRFCVDLHDRPDLDALMQGDRMTLAVVAALAMVAHGTVGDV